jgi:hypothetical protein
MHVLEGASQKSVVHSFASSHAAGTHAVPQQVSLAPHANMRTQVVPLHEACWHPVVRQVAGVQVAYWQSFVASQ